MLTRHYIKLVPFYFNIKKIILRMLSYKQNSIFKRSRRIFMFFSNNFQPSAFGYRNWVTAPRFIGKACPQPAAASRLCRDAQRAQSPRQTAQAARCDKQCLAKCCPSRPSSSRQTVRQQARCSRQWL